MEKSPKLNISASTLKLLACAFMLCDHVGVALFPGTDWLRMIGRLAFPLFAFFIAEGCRYTSDRRRHFLSVFALGFVCELGYVLYSGQYYGNILLTFSLAILVIYALQELRNKGRAALLTGFALLTGTVYILTGFINFDYGFTGIMATVIAAVPMDRVDRNSPPDFDRKSFYIRLGIFALAMAATALESSMGTMQLWSLGSIALLLLYSGKGGNKKLKYFFYIFYPVHLLLIEAAAMFIL